MLLTNEHILMQVVVITDPAIAMDLLKSPYVDKIRFLYSFLDPVSRSAWILEHDGYPDKRLCLRASILQMH